jgi:hypothetical protein
VPGARAPHRALPDLALLGLAEAAVVGQVLAVLAVLVVVALEQ